MPQFYVDDDDIYGDGGGSFPTPSTPTPIPTPGGGDAGTGQGPRVPALPGDVDTQDRRRGGGGGESGYPGQGGPNIRIPGAPVFNAPTFNRPTMQDAYNEPGYQFRAAAGNQALERSASARGVLRTGGTLKDLVEYGQNFAAQEYGQVFNRALSSYDRQYQGARDAFAPTMANYQARVNAEMARSMADYNRQWDSYTFARRGGGGGGGGRDPIESPPPWDPNRMPLDGGGGGMYTPAGPFDQPQTGPSYGGGASAYGNGDDWYDRYY